MRFGFVPAGRPALARLRLRASLFAAGSGLAPAPGLTAPQHDAGHQEQTQTQRHGPQCNQHRRTGQLFGQRHLVRARPAFHLDQAFLDFDQAVAQLITLGAQGVQVLFHLLAQFFGRGVGPRIQTLRLQQEPQLFHGLAQFVDLGIARRQTFFDRGTRHAFAALVHRFEAVLHAHGAGVPVLDVAQDLGTGTVPITPGECRLRRQLQYRPGPQRIHVLFGEGLGIGLEEGKHGFVDRHARGQIKGLHDAVQGVAALNLVRRPVGRFGQHRRHARGGQAERQGQAAHGARQSGAIAAVFHPSIQT